MTLEFETMEAGGKFSDECRLPILDLRPYMPDDILAELPRFLGRWEDGNTMRILLDDNYGETAAEGTCDFVVFTSETLECQVSIPNQKRIAAGVSDVDYMQFMKAFCAAHRIQSFPTLFRADGSFDTGAPMAEEFLQYILGDLRKRYMQKLRNEAWYGDQTNANEIAGLLTQLNAGPVSTGDGCELYEMPTLNWSTLTGAGGAASQPPSAVIDAASDIITIHGMDFAGNEGLNMGQFLVLWLERLFEYDLAAYRDDEIVFELWTGKGQAVCIANLAACMQPCEGCVNPLSDPQIRDRAADFRKNKVIWFYPYDNVKIAIRTSPELVDEMFLVPKSIGGRPMLGWVFRDQDEQIMILNGEMPYYGAVPGRPSPDALHGTDEVDAAANFERAAFSINVQKNHNCIDYWINSESAIVIFGWNLWLRFQYVDCASLVPTQKQNVMGIASSACADPGGNNLTFTVAALEDYGAVSAGDTYIVYGEDGLTALIGTVVSYDTGTDALILDMGGAFDCTLGGGMDLAVIVKHYEN